MNNMDLFCHYVLKFWKCYRQVNKIMSEQSSNDKFKKTRRKLGSARSRKGKKKGKKSQHRSRVHFPYDLDSLPLDSSNIHEAKPGGRFIGVIDEYYLNYDIEDDIYSSLTISDEDEVPNHFKSNPTGLDSDDSLFTCSDVDMNDYSYDYPLETAIFNGDITPFSIGIEDIDIEEYQRYAEDIKVDSSDDEPIELIPQEITPAVSDRIISGDQIIEEYATKVIEPESSVSILKHSAFEGDNETASLSSSVIDSIVSIVEPIQLTESTQRTVEPVEDDEIVDNIDVTVDDTLVKDIPTESIGDGKVSDSANVTVNDAIEPIQSDEGNAEITEIPRTTASSNVTKYKKQVDTVKKISAEGIERFITKYTSKYTSLYKSVARKEVHMTENELNSKGENCLFKCNPYNSIQLISILETLRKINKIPCRDKKALRTLIRELVPRVCNDMFMKIFRVTQKKSENLIRTLYPEPTCPV